MLDCVCQEKHVKVIHLRSRQSRSRPNENEIYAEIETGDVTGQWRHQMTEVVETLKPMVRSITVHTPQSMTSSKQKPDSLPRNYVSLDRMDTKCTYNLLR